MAKPLVAIIGRPNVGKSTFFNRLAGHRIAIVDDTPGVTRDRLYADAEWLRHSFTVIDTGGIEPYAEDIILQQMKRQAQIAMETADVILFFVDGQDGVTSTDEDVADMLRRAGKPVVLVVNKIDHVTQEEKALDFYTFGLGEPFTVSSIQGLGIGDLLDEVVAHFPEPEAEPEEGAVIRIAVVGRPNVGKSSLVNALLQEDRHIVSNIPGTTRDAVDSTLTVDGQDYVLIDTAGIRRKSRVEDATLERYSVIRALAAIRRCDVALVVVDATAGITEQDVKIAGYVHEEGKACVVVVNKWDAVEKDDHTMSKFQRDVLADLAFMHYAPSLFISALQGQRLPKVLPLAQMVYHHAGTRITTGTLNDVVGDAAAINPPPFVGGRRLRIYYATQVSVHPPTFVLFVNDPERMHYSYLRYLENHFRKTFTLDGTPIRFILRSRNEDKGS